MPVIKSAKKKLRKDRVRELRNSKVRLGLKKIIKTTHKKPTSENISKAFKIIDKAAKTGIVHRNKAARIKSGLSKLIKKAPKKTIPSKPVAKKSSKAKKS